MSPYLQEPVRKQNAERSNRFLPQPALAGVSQTPWRLLLPTFIRIDHEFFEGPPMHARRFDEATRLATKGDPCKNPCVMVREQLFTRVHRSIALQIAFHCYGLSGALLMVL